MSTSSPQTQEKALWGFLTDIQHAPSLLSDRAWRKQAWALVERVAQEVGVDGYGPSWKEPRKTSATEALLWGYLADLFEQKDILADEGWCDGLRENLADYARSHRAATR